MVLFFYLFCENNENDLDQQGPSGTPGIAYQIFKDGTIGDELPENIPLNEDDSYQYAITLLSRPSEDVTVTISLPDNSPDNLNLSSAEEIVSGPSASITFTFTNERWRTPKLVRLTLSEDNIAQGNQSLVVTNVSISNDPNYNGLIRNVTLSTNDNETEGITYISAANSMALPTSITLEEGGENNEYNYTIVLNTQPTHDVMVRIMLPDNIPANLTLSSVVSLIQEPSESITLNFLPENWNFPQALRFTLLDDNVIDENKNLTIEHISESKDPNYNDLSRDLTVQTTDNDAPGVIYTVSGGSTELPSDIGLAESEEYQYEISLKTRPQADVIITISLPDFPFELPQSFKLASAESTVPDADGLRSVTLTFMPENWNTSQAIRLALQEDTIIEENKEMTIKHITMSADTSYEMLSRDLVVSTTDNDTIGITFTEIDGSVLPNSIILSEGNMDVEYEYNIVLNTQPTHDVRVNLSVPDTAPLSLELFKGTSTNPTIAGESRIFVFTPATYNTPQKVKLVLKADDIFWKNRDVIIMHSPESTDPAYNDPTLAHGIMLTLQDTDSAQVLYDPPLTSAIALLKGESHEYQVQLNGPPSGDVMVTISIPGDTRNNFVLSSGSKMTTDSRKSIVLTFTPDDGDHMAQDGEWNFPQTVNLNLMFDPADSLTRTIAIRHTHSSTEDNAFNSLPSQDFSVELISRRNCKTPSGSIPRINNFGYSISDRGHFGSPPMYQNASSYSGFSWNKVNGAARYIIFHRMNNEAVTLAYIARDEVGTNAPYVNIADVNASTNTSLTESSGTLSYTTGSTASYAISGHAYRGIAFPNRFGIIACNSSGNVIGFTNQSTHSDSGRDNDIYFDLLDSHITRGGERIIVNTLINGFWLGDFNRPGEYITIGRGSGKTPVPISSGIYRVEVYYNTQVDSVAVKITITTGGSATLQNVTRNATSTNRWNDGRWPVLSDMGMHGTLRFPDFTAASDVTNLGIRIETTQANNGWDVVGVRLVRVGNAP